jgi:hypothetical protein
VAAELSILSAIFQKFYPKAMTLDTITVRGDKSLLTDAEERPAGVWVGNYMSKTITIRNADIQGMRAGISSPFFHSQRPELGGGDASVAIENSYFRDYVGVVVATAYSELSYFSAC